MVSKLILTGATLEEAIEVDISAAKSGSIISGFQPSNTHFELDLLTEHCFQRFSGPVFRVMRSTISVIALSVSTSREE